MAKILVIEDELSIRENILELLDMREFDVIGAENGSVGLKMAMEQSPDLIICDVTMPEMDGYSVLKALRENPSTANIPFIFLTARADRLDMRAGMELGADDYLVKPCLPAELLKAITIRLEKQQRQQQYYLNNIKQPKVIAEPIDCDPLTELPTRVSLENLFQRFIQKVYGTYSPVFLPPNSSQKVPIFCLGLERFNRINDSLGYEMGDFLLKSFALRLSESVGDSGIVARLNGDQFAVILSPVKNKETAAQKAQIIQNHLSLPFQVHNTQVFITASIGIAFYPDNGQDIDKLLQLAKKAMNYARRQGGNRCEIYSPTFASDTDDWLALETDLRYAIDREELRLHYQPQVSLQTGQIVGCEALLRWYHPERGLISPAKFIPIAEQTGIIEVIGEWVLKTACRQLKQWHENNFKFLRVGVNLSGRQFTQPNLCERIAAILEESGIHPKYLDLELTESSLVQNAELATRRLQAIKSIGVKISIDDFGTGYSSLSYLQKFPFDILKIDQCFINNISDNPKNTAITTALILMAHQMNLKVIAEGVETPGQLDFLCRHNCDEMQGYLFGKPVSASEFQQLLSANKCLQLP
ncbi:EAL domain-containing protein [Ancylothrix sp. C2]|uniref:EAL domain-containing response regulator n=1 Tax=Ancylothrix sp. D3o TaxID=2953691 RepID=UPI0021BB1578|nr:EAL domain-containing response regulator [Ancylothrix sp. D3o]MCT7949570.1 EAL domain-containing protein [Ancylothrix sp. D3o]